MDDGELPIDSNLVVRTIRKLTTQRNNSLHYGSDAGAEMAATYHSVIGKVKLHGSSARDFIGLRVCKRGVSSSVLSNGTTLLFVFKDVQVSNQKLIWAKIEF